MTKWIRISPRDNVEVLVAPDGESDIPVGHKRAITALDVGDTVIKYGCPIGRVTAPVKAGEWVHTHNMRSMLEDGEKREACRESAAPASVCVRPKQRFFNGFVRPDGSVGIRNEVWIVPTVGCVGNISREIARRAQGLIGGSLEAIVGYSHPYGCSQLGEDAALTVRALAGIIRNPNAAGVLVLGLGCENSGISRLKEALGDWDDERVKFLNAQDTADEVEAGLLLVKELADRAKGIERTPCPWSKLTIGLKCGGSDGLSGITANPLLGRFADGLCAAGGSVILTEVPEMFGAEKLLFARAENGEVRAEAKEMIEGFYDYFRRHGEPVNENPSPGNLSGGITTLEEKSLGCVQKGGNSAVTDVLDYGEPCRKAGVSLLWGPGNDLVSSAALAMSGAQLVLFSTGRGTPFGCPVPTVKISTNSALAVHKGAWIDFDAGRALSEKADALDEEFAELVTEVCSGRKTAAEALDRSGLAIFKDGVIL